MKICINVLIVYYMNKYFFKVEVKVINGIMEDVPVRIWIHTVTIVFMKSSIANCILLT